MTNETEFQSTALPGVILIKPHVFGDARGFFLETYQRERYADRGIDVGFVQDNHSRSKHATLRGLHVNTERPQGKLVRCVAGEIFDVAVDVRPGSPTYRQWVGARLSSQNFHQIWVPAGYAHGFCVLSDVAEVEYKVTDYYHPQGDVCIAWNDPDIGIEWPLESAPLLSQQDQAAAPLAELADKLPRYSGASQPMDART